MSTNQYDLIGYLYLWMVIVWLPSKHSSWWRRTEDVLKTSWRRLQRNTFLSFKTSSWKCLEDVLKTSWRRRLTDTSWRRLEDVFEKGLANTSWRRLERWKIVTLKTFSRHLGKQEIFSGISLLQIFISNVWNHFESLSTNSSSKNWKFARLTYPWINSFQIKFWRF